MSDLPLDPAVEAERLRQARALIEEVLREFDICASVKLAGRAGRFESFLHMVATWSNVTCEPTPNGLALRLRSKAADYGDDHQTQRRDLEWSVGMIRGLAEMLGSDALAMLQVAQRFDERTRAEHTPFRQDDPRKDTGG